MLRELFAIIILMIFSAVDASSKLHRDFSRYVIKEVFIYIASEWLGMLARCQFQGWEKIGPCTNNGLHAARILVSTLSSDAYSYS